MRTVSKLLVSAPAALAAAAVLTLSAGAPAMAREPKAPTEATHKAKTVKAKANAGHKSTHKVAAKKVKADKAG